VARESSLLLIKDTCRHTKADPIFEKPEDQALQIVTGQRQNGQEHFWLGPAWWNKPSRDFPTHFIELFRLEKTFKIIKSRDFLLFCHLVSRKKEMM